MTPGYIVFYSGVFLLIVTIIISIVFAVRKPKYIPDSESYGRENPNSTQHLRNGYPTERMTIRQGTPYQTEQSTAAMEDFTEGLTELLQGEVSTEATELLPPTEKLEK